MITFVGKKSAIIKAYGIHYNELSPFIDEDGWCFGGAKMGQFKNEELEFDEKYSSGNAKMIELFRPKSLSGIESNNGWFKINDVSDIPFNDYALYNGCNIDKSILFDQHDPLNSTGLRQAYRDNKITHFRPIKKYNQPIY